MGTELAEVYKCKQQWVMVLDIYPLVLAWQNSLTGFMLYAYSDKIELLP